MLEASVLITVMCGFFGIIFKKNLVMKIVSMDVMSTGVIAYYVLIASHHGQLTPIVSYVKSSVDSSVASDVISSASDASMSSLSYADPVPQAVILTAIVIGFSIQALMLVGVMKLSRDHPTLDCREIELRQTP
ncbi:MAG: cation:proton antiporter subunit C [Pegethrix bostrychoides GSE-TBD4-15B]|jgi:multicomponent Na+:H+ antiporter subunit C|uniref:Cation:proton antiporter subunit C n=1 Tax=Pegethrix bostrychoides GSE-TBD4-15B TaxID=2839662 RepID=A0A951P9P9_9CYAN|nr:cation:proton antiporter subunit C [Pegethrix bostrychoides GSE-TBD4-15B]